MNFVCHFCNKPCTDRAEADMVADWWRCITCQTSYEVHYTGTIYTICMDTIVREFSYGLDLSFEKNESRIIKYPGKPDDTVVIVVSFPYILKGVTPSNLHDKIKTYINFS